MIVGVALYALLAALFGDVLTWTRSVTVCRQPGSVAYDDGTYSVETLIPTVHLSLNTPPTRAVIGRGGGYGVFVTLSASSDESLKVTCRWSADEVTITEPSGISHTVPATEFTGGR